MEPALPRWAVPVIGSWPMCLGVALIVFIVVSLLFRFILPARNLGARCRLIASIGWAAALAPIPSLLVLFIVTRGRLVGGAVTLLQERAAGVILCLTVLQILAAVALYAWVHGFRLRAGSEAAPKQMWDRGLVFLTADEWARFRAALANQWLWMLFLVLIGEVLVSVALIGTFWRPQEAVFGGQVLPARILTVLGIALEALFWTAALIRSGLVGSFGRR